MIIREMAENDWAEVEEIYLEGMMTKNATFHSHIPTYEVWDKTHLNECRYISLENGKVTGFVVLSRINNRETYKGVCEVSIYVGKDFRRKNYGYCLLEKAIAESEKIGIWTLQSVIIDDNIASLKLHEKCGFRMVGYRERIARDKYGNWHNTYLLERRSKNI